MEIPDNRHFYFCKIVASNKQLFDPKILWHHCWQNCGESDLILSPTWGLWSLTSACCHNSNLYAIVPRELSFNVSSIIPANPTFYSLSKCKLYLFQMTIKCKARANRPAFGRRRMGKPKPYKYCWLHRHSLDLGIESKLSSSGFRILMLMLLSSELCWVSRCLWDVHTRFNASIENVSPRNDVTNM